MKTRTKNPTPSDLRKLAAKIRRRSERISAKIRAVQRDVRKSQPKAR